MEHLYRYIREMIDIASVSGAEGDVARYLEKDLAARKFRVELQPVEGDRLNVYARLGEKSPRGVLCTHIDTVPPFIQSSEDDEYIYGRGSCDAKGIVAAMVHAAEGLRANGVDDVAMLFVVGEEVDSIGALAAAKMEIEPEWVLVGEPTENKMATGHKGNLKFVLKAEGKAAHSAYPHLGDSAIERLLRTLEKLRTANWGESEVLGEATINIGTVSGGLAANVIAPFAQADVFVRVVGSAEEAERKLNEIVGGDTKLSVEMVSECDAVFCETLDGYETAPVSFGTDIPSLKRFGKTLLLGPGSILDAHTAGEKIGKTEVVEAVTYYQNAVGALLESKV